MDNIRMIKIFCSITISHKWIAGVVALFLVSSFFSLVHLRRGYFPWISSQQRGPGFIRKWTWEPGVVHSHGRKLLVLQAKYLYVTESESQESNSMWQCAARFLHNIHFQMYPLCIKCKKGVGTYYNCIWQCHTLMTEDQLFSITISLNQKKTKNNIVY